MKFPEQYRWQNAPHGYASNEGDTFGLFRVSGREANGRGLNIIAIAGEPDDHHAGWDHVSVTLSDHPKRCPSWDEMCLVKALFWEPSERVVQFHPAESDYVNQHPGCLHLWKFTAAPFPVPPTICV